MTTPRGLSLLIGSVLLLFAFQLGRVLLYSRQDPAVFVTAHAGQPLVELGQGFCPQGIVQKSDAELQESVIEMTCDADARKVVLEKLVSQPLQKAEHLEIVRKAGQNWGFERSWMAAAKQIELGIPLQVDRLTTDDWCDLPGVGPALATAIIENRQQNGDFGTLGRLIRVKGIGPARINAWKNFF